MPKEGDRRFPFTESSGRLQGIDGHDARCKRRRSNEEIAPAVVKMLAVPPRHCHTTRCLLPARCSRTRDSRALSSVGMARWPLTRRNLDSARSRPAAHQRFRISPSRHQVTRAVTRRVTLRADSIGLVVANVRRSAPDTPKRTTVSVSSTPSRRLTAASGLIRISQVAVSSSDFLAAS